MSSFLKSANNLRHNSLLSRKHPSRTPTTTEHHSLPLSKSLNQRETPLKKATHSSSSITRHCSIAGMKQASSDASLVCRSRGFLGRLTRKPLTVTKSAESGMSELGVGSGTSDDSAASVEPGEVLLSEPALIFSPGVPINLKINLTNNLPSGDSSFNAGVGDASHKRLISSKTNSKLQRGKLRNSNNKPVDPVVFVCDLAVASPQPMNSNNNNINNKRNINNNTKGSNTSYSTPSNNTTSTAAAEAGKSATTKSKMSSTSAVTGLVRLPKYRLNPHNYMLADNR